MSAAGKLEGREGHHEEKNKIVGSEHESLRGIMKFQKVYRKRKRLINKQSPPSPNGRLFCFNRVRKSLAGSTLPTWCVHEMFSKLFFLDQKVHILFEILLILEFEHKKGEFISWNRFPKPLILTEVTEPSAMSARLYSSSASSSFPLSALASLEL